MKLVLDLAVLCAVTLLEARPGKNLKNDIWCS